jgi:hypothetical protein
MDKKGRMLTAGGIFFLANALLAGCDSPGDGSGVTGGSQGDWGSENAMAERSTGVICEVAEVAPGRFRIVKEYPSNVVGVVAQRLDGSLEVVSEARLRELFDSPTEGSGYGLGGVLAGGLVGYLMGRNTGPNPSVYASQELYRQSVQNREVVDKRRREEEQYAARTGTRQSGLRFYTGSGRPPAAQKQTVGGRTTGFFSHFTSSFHVTG